MPIIGKFQRKQRKQIPAHIGFQATAGDNTLHLRTQTKGYNCTIDWGDGSETIVPVNGGNVIHNYAEAGLYDIKIRGTSFAGFYVNIQVGREKYVAAYSMGQWAVDTMTSAASSFSSCTNLVYIDAKLFAHNPKITTFSYCFSGCFSLATIPADLFRYNTLAYHFGLCFSGCSSLTEIPADLFRYNIAATYIPYCFNNCTSLTIVPIDLFRYNILVTAFFYCFYGCSNLTTIPADLFRYNMRVSNFSNCFNDCRKLTLRLDIFGTDYANRFNGKTVNFTNCFNRSSFTGTQGTAPELWRFTGLTATKPNCFGGAGNSATSLSNYASIPSDWK